ncbi:MAG: 5-formyltetrahydrofolate cyclo-ligase [Stackebrandtia sp.]
MRTDILSHRKELSARDLDGAAEKVLPALLRNLGIPVNSTVAAYAPLGTEPGGYLTKALSDAGHRVLLPVVLDDLDLDWAQYTGAQHTTHRGLSEPDSKPLGAEAVAGVDALVVPALAVGSDGYRLGRGGGCYDRALARVGPGVPIVALLHDGEWPRAVPREPHDRPVTAVVTPSEGYVSLGTAS